MKTIRKILVANRGEIALRIMRSCREMGISTVAVFSEADRNAPFVRFADEAVCIGASSALESYLNGKKIIQVCKKLKADAIHPGYGFLAENVNFNQEVQKAGIVLIGPSPEAMQKMGDKLSAKTTAKKIRVPLVPGTDEPIQNVQMTNTLARKIGFPVLLKASAGGGGKGMRIVESEKDMEEAIKMATSEAESAFGNGQLFIEKYIAAPRHIEIQILADRYGNVVHLFERECSIQRRHQKVIEETPSPAVSPDLREQMGQCAVHLVKACGYVGAGTVEFLVEKATEKDLEKKQWHFYFLEVNTRLQVEHPVTEMITGVDLVKEQIKIAMGEKLSFTQNDLHISGHAMEVRVYAENPENNFLPETGCLSVYRLPYGPGIRVDDGYEEGMDIPLHYDPMISKLIVHGSNRKETLARMLRAIEDFKIAGVETTLPFCRFVLKHKAFVSGDFDTNFVKKYFSSAYLYSENKEESKIAALVASAVLQKETAQPIHPYQSGNDSLWKKKRLSELS